ncbi:MAG: hypothetical protein HRU33_20010 [Rhodobacteraceae bacterium]|nr:hypothetical protein [Paracoccaceae bacterium]
MRNAAGYLVKGVSGLNLIGVGRAEDTIDNTGGANGGDFLVYRAGVFRYVNDGTDPITIADIGQVCFVIDDQTVPSSS